MENEKKKRKGKGKIILLSIIGVFVIAVVGVFIVRAINAPELVLHTNTQTDSESAPIVYMTTEISPEALVAIYEALGCEVNGSVAIKIHTGEPGGTNFLTPSLIKDLVELLNGTIVETNSAFPGQRRNTALHMQVAKDHGFTAIAPVDILDADGAIELPVRNGSRISQNQIGSRYRNYDFHVVLSHFKGHEMAGFGGALKNISVGYATPAGKLRLHGGGYAEGVLGNLLLNTLGDQNAFLEAMAEAAGTIIDDAGENIIYINIMNNLSVDCDCDSSPAEPDMHDIGILASLDPLALDKACVDLIYAAPDGQSLIARIESLNGLRILEYGAEIGLGSLEYRLVSIDN